MVKIVVVNSIPAIVIAKISFETFLDDVINQEKGGEDHYSTYFFNTVNL